VQSSRDKGTKHKHRRVVEIMSEGLFCTVFMGLLEKVSAGAVVCNV